MTGSVQGNLCDRRRATAFRNPGGALRNLIAETSVDAPTEASGEHSRGDAGRGDSQR